MASPRTRLVESLWISHAPVAFRSLCERAVPPSAQLLVLDLDRTLHLGRNMGELLGWEICAWRSYGDGYLAGLEQRRGRGRFCLDLRRPLATLRYLLGSGRAWLPPGLFYLWWCRIAAKVPALRLRSYLRFGPEPVRVVQRVPQRALFQQMEDVPEATLRELVARVWTRYLDDLTLGREDVEWLRRRSPRLRVVLSSASPQAVVDEAAVALGLDEAIGSTALQINAGRAKLATLRARHPELGAPGVISVGISDTAYGEDHCWTDAFTHLADVNSTAPFPPVAAAGSPLTAIFSTPLLTRGEQRERLRDPGWLDPRRGAPAAGQRERLFGRSELEALLSPLSAAIERLAAEVELHQGRELSATVYALDRALERARRLVEAGGARSA
jgi:hypothetical protein